MRRGALALALKFRRTTDDVATVMVYAFRAGDSYVIVSSTPV